MQSINLLGLKAAGLTIIVLFAVFGAYKTVQSLLQKPSPENETVPSQEEHSSNSDWDGLIQNLYRNDQTAPQEETAQDIQIQLSEEDVEEILTQLNVPSPDTYTGRYLAGLPTDATREYVLNKDRLTAFVNENKGTLLPHVTQEDIITDENSSSGAIQDYLKNISHLHNPEITHISNTDIEKAYALNVANREDPSLQNIISSLKKNKDIILNTPVPVELSGFHIKLVAASQALIDNLQLLQSSQQDFIGGLIGAKKIEELGTVFEEIAYEIKELEEE